MNIRKIDNLKARCTPDGGRRRMEEKERKYLGGASDMD
jgi:hypothetical protein